MFRFLKNGFSAYYQFFYISVLVFFKMLCNKISHSLVISNNNHNINSHASVVDYSI